MIYSVVMRNSHPDQLTVALAQGCLKRAAGAIVDPGGRDHRILRRFSMRALQSAIRLGAVAILIDQPHCFPIRIEPLTSAQSDATAGAGNRKLHVPATSGLSNASKTLR